MKRWVGLFLFGTSRVRREASASELQQEESEVRQQDLQASRAACHGHEKGVFSGEGEQFEAPSLAAGRWVT